MEYLILFSLVIILIIYIVCFEISNFSNCHSENSLHYTSPSSDEPCRTYLTDREYLLHMIPHHQVAVDMSERLLLHTNHSYLLYFARKLIVDQQAEIFMMNNLLKQGNYNYKSPLFTIPE